MARNKEVAVILLDVGMHMEDVLEPASTAIRNFVTSKMINKPSHEVALFLFGTTGTSNSLHEEFVAEGDDSQYLNITLEQALRPPEISYLTSLKDIQPQEGASDFVDALTVAVDSLYREIKERPELERATVGKRIILVSNFLCAAKEDEEGEFAAALISRMQDKAISLEVVSIEEPTEDKEAEKARTANLAVLDGILGQVHSSKRVAHDALEARGAFRFKEVSATAYYAGPFTIGNAMTIKVKVTKKSSQEHAPSMEKYSGLSQSSDATHEVIYDREFKRAGDESGEAIPPEDLVKAFRYGKELIPISAEELRMLRYQPDKGFQLVGVVPRDTVPRHFFMADTWLVAPEKGNTLSFTALSALARALDQDGRAAVVWFLPRTGSDITMGYVTPLLGQGRESDCLLMNQLPYAEDLREASFASFAAKPDLIPNEAQLAAADALIDALLEPLGNPDRLMPESTVNPTLQRFLHVMGELALDGNKSADSMREMEDPLLDQLVRPQLDKLPGEAQALANLESLFKLRPKEAERSAGRDGAEPKPMLAVEGDEADVEPRVQEVGTASPLEDFDTLLEAAADNATKQQHALDSLKAATMKIVDTSMGSRNHGKAVRCVMRIRGTSKQLQKSNFFNSFLEELAAKYEHSETQAGFWTMLMAERVTLISAAEAEDGVPEEQAQDFLKQHTPGLQAAQEAPTAQQDQEEDFEAME